MLNIILCEENSFHAFKNWRKNKRKKKSLNKEKNNDGKLLLKEEAMVTLGRWVLSEKALTAEKLQVCPLTAPSKGTAEQHQAKDGGRGGGGGDISL